MTATDEPVRFDAPTTHRAAADVPDIRGRLVDYLRSSHGAVDYRLSIALHGHPNPPAAAPPDIPRRLADAEAERLAGAWLFWAGHVVCGTITETVPPPCPTRAVPVPFGFCVLGTPARVGRDWVVAFSWGNATNGRTFTLYREPMTVSAGWTRRPPPMVPYDTWPMLGPDGHRHPAAAVFAVMQAVRDGNAETYPHRFSWWGRKRAARAGLSTGPITCIEAV